MTVRTFFVSLIVAALLGTTGCGNPKAPELAPVRGLITFRGMPLPGGLIVFTPDDDSGSHGPSALGMIGPDGRYTLTTEGAPGAPPGRHRVTVAGPTSSSWSLPAHLRDPALSGLHADVIAGRENVLDIPLKDQ